jgi:pimeloyl-ACP methyl ester carboxylesterase
MRRWRGLKALVHDAVDHTTALIEEGHDSAARVALRAVDLVAPGNPRAREINAARAHVTSNVLASVRAVNRLVRTVTDLGVDVVEAVAAPAEPAPVTMRSDATRRATTLADAALGAVNGVVGDALAARTNGLALDMSLRAGAQYLTLTPEGLRDAVPDPSSSLVVFVHGLCATEWSWCLGAEAYHGDPGANFGTLLARDLGVTPLFLRYNSGRHVSENGRDLAALLDALVAHWPVPVKRVALVGHSMGGLVIRSACHLADADRRPWRERLTHVACLASPHRGAALEKLGNVLGGVLEAIDLPGTRIPGRILQGRSAGIKDLRYGYIRDEDWAGFDPDALLEDRSGPLALLDDVAYCFVSATVTRDPEHPVGALLGDLLVRGPSASPEALTRRAFALDTGRYGAVLHHQVQCHPDVYAQLRAFLAT